MAIQKLVDVQGIPTWVRTGYRTLKEAREASPKEPPNFFRVEPLRMPF